ncbi:MAG: ATP synthase subunit I [Planctomycetota bacterium]
MAASDRPDPVGRFARKVLVVSGLIVAVAAVASPLWAWGRPDRAWGFALGAAASLARFAWSVRLARRLGEAGPRQYAGERMMGLALLGAALAVAGAVDGVDLAAAAAGVFLATAATVAAALLETRRPADVGPKAEARPSPDTGRRSGPPAETPGRTR